jgi:ribosomal protein L11 methyltransferase
VTQQFIELRYDVPASRAEDACEILVASGASGVEERDADTIAKPAAGRVLLVVWVPAGEDEAFVARARLSLAAVIKEPLEPQRETRHEDEWRDAWKRYFHARPVGRFVIVPSWEQYTPTAGQVILDLDPGRAFGTGGHASTRLCLLALDAITTTPNQVLDVGCGSGVLAIAAARRWPHLRGIGVDIDPDSVEVSRENAERNGVADRLSFATTRVEHLTERAPLVLANIQPEILIPMVPFLIARMEARATLILAGIIDEAADQVAAAYAQLGAPRRLHEEGWTALVYTRGEPT